MRNAELDEETCGYCEKDLRGINDCLIEHSAFSTQPSAKSTLVARIHGQFLEDARVWAYAFIRPPWTKASGATRSPVFESDPRHNGSFYIPRKARRERMQQ